MDRAKDKIIGANIGNFPPKFLDLIAEYSLATDGIWCTFASSNEIAKEQISSFIKDMTGEYLAPDVIEIVSITSGLPRTYVATKKSKTFK